LPTLRRNHVHELAGIACFVLILLLANSFTLAAQVSVTTYHNDTYRTGWNSSETVLTPSNVNASQFGLLATVKVDDQVDAQPLLVTGVNITAGSHQGQHDVVYVVTGNDTVYAIDANAGTILLSQHLGTPVRWPLGCNNSGPNVGVTSTPVIETGSNTLYLIAYTQDSTGPAYRLHALNLGNLTDTVTPQVVAASHTLSDGTTFPFNATYQRQRPGLLEANGNIYAGFGSFCDFAPNLSRGWLLGWNAATLAPLSANQVFDTLATSPNSFFLSSIWMSGYGLAADDSGNVVFVTGNSDQSGTTYNGVTNIQESTIKVSSDLTTVVDLFTPSNWSTLDEGDTDFGSGGVMVLPNQPGSTPHLAVAAGKFGSMYLMNEDHLGGYSPSSNNVFGTYSVGACWCGESYFVDPADGAARVVSSGGNRVEVWKLVTSPSPKLTLFTRSPAISTGQNGGFFTSVSSNGNSNPIIWALSRPVSQSPASMVLYAFNPDSAGKMMTTLFRGIGGLWPNQGGDSNQVPMIANGKVYVASNKQLRIFGLKPDSRNKTK
jgi:hypothetical protein